MNGSSKTAFLLALLAVAAIAPAQQLVLPNAFAGSVGPANNGFFATAARTYQVQYASSELMNFIPVGSTFTGISLRLKNNPSVFTFWPPPGGLTFSNFEIALSRGANLLAAVSTNFAANQFQPIVVRSGPFHIPSGAFSLGSSPNSFGVEIPFIPWVYPGGDLVVTIRYSGATVTDSSIVLDSVSTGLLGAAFQATTATATTGTATTVAISRITVFEEYQRNQPGASLIHNESVTNGMLPAVVNACTGGPITVAAQSTLSGFPYDIAIAFNNPVSRSDAASTTLSDGQVFNVPLGDPSLVFLWSGASVPALPPFSPLSLTFPAPAGPVNWCSQMLVVDPSSPSLLRLSQVTGVGINPAQFGTIPGPTAEDGFTLCRLGMFPFCGFSLMPFFGANYTSFWVNSNGRVTFGDFDQDFSPSLIEASFDRPFVGFWTDLTPSPGTITVTGSPSAVTVNYNGVRYSGEASPQISFSIRLEGSGNVAITGLGGIAPNPLSSAGLPGADAQLIGICNGFLGSGLNNASFPFGSTVAGGPGVGLVDFWEGTAATAPNGIRLCRTIQDNQVGGSLGRLDFTPVGTGYQALNH